MRSGASSVTAGQGDASLHVPEESASTTSLQEQGQGETREHPRPRHPSRGCQSPKFPPRFPCRVSVITQLTDKPGTQTR